jgi:hypothetical protein
MSRFGWAYVSTLLTGAVANGPTNSIQFNSGSQILSGSSNFTFDPATNFVSASNDILVGGQVISAGSIRSNGAIKGNYSTFSGNFNVANTSYFIGIDSNASAITASLLAANNYFGGQSLIFKDIGGKGSTNNILIKPSGSQTIDGASGGILITTNSGSITLISNGTNQFYIVASR